MCGFFLCVFVCLCVCSFVEFLGLCCVLVTEQLSGGARAKLFSQIIDRNLEVQNDQILSQNIYLSLYDPGLAKL